MTHTGIVKKWLMIWVREQIIQSFQFQSLFLVSGKSKADLGDKFWDLVVITASDEDQRVAFEIQIQSKLAKHQIPHGLPYLVYADPPGPKIGCAVYPYQPIIITIRRLIVRSREVSKIGSSNYRIALRFYMQMGSPTVEVPVKFQSDRPILSTNLAASRPCERSYRILKQGPGSLKMIA